MKNTEIIILTGVSFMFGYLTRYVMGIIKQAWQDAQANAATAKTKWDG